MSTFRLTIALFVSLSILGCTEEPPIEVLAPGGLNASKLAKPGKKTTAVQILIPVPTGLDPALVPPIFTAHWIAQNAKRVRTILVSAAQFNDSWDEALEYIRNNPDAPEWTEWVKYKPRKDQGTSWTSPALDFGRYVFAVEARGPGGEVTAIELGTNAARILVSNRTTGPLLTVFNRYTGSLVSSTTTTPPWILDIPSGVAMSFTLRASAAQYGGIVVGYRYGWDIIDPDDDEQWDTPFMPFEGETAEVPPRTYFFGTHTAYMEVIDNYGFKSRVAVQLGVIPAFVDRPLLIVDDWVEGSPGFEPTGGAIPSDEEHDAFWLDMALFVEGFDPAQDVLELQPGQIPPLHVLLSYKNIIWNASGSHGATSSSALADIIRFVDPRVPRPGGGTITPDYIALYMAAGGHVLLCGQELMTMVINRASFDVQPPAFPIIHRYELGGDQDGRYEDSDVGVWGIGDASFAYAEGCLNVLDIAYITNPNAVRRAPNQACPVNLIREHDARTDGVRATLPLDLVSGGGFPRLELRPEVAGDPSRFYHEDNAGLQSDIYNPAYFADLTACGQVAETSPPRGCIEPIYGNECVNTASVIYGAPVAYWTSVYADRVPDGVGGVAARSAIWGFHPVYFNPEQVRAALDIILFDEWQLERPSWALGLGVYGNTTGTEPVSDDGGGVVPVYVVHSSTTDIAGAEFAAPLPPCADWIYLFDEPRWPSTIGNSQTGVTVNYGACQDSPVHVLTIQVFVQQRSPECCLYSVSPHPQTGGVRAMDCSGNWYTEDAPPTFINGYPWQCGAPAAASNWRRIRALN